MEVASVTSGTCACLQKWQEWVFGSLGDLRLHLFAKTLVELHMASLVSLTMCPGDLSLLFHGLLLPKETHSVESLKFAQEFRLKDSDVVVVTYPKSGRCFWRLFFSEFVAFVIFTKSVFFLFLCPWWFYFDWIYSTTTKRLFPKIITLKWCYMKHWYLVPKHCTCKIFQHCAATLVVWTVDFDHIASVQQVDNLTEGILFFFFLKLY